MQCRTILHFDNLSGQFYETYTLSYGRHFFCSWSACYLRMFWCLCYRRVCVSDIIGVSGVLLSPAAAMQCHGKAAALMAVIFRDPHTQLSSLEWGAMYLQHQLSIPST